MTTGVLLPPTKTGNDPCLPFGPARQWVFPASVSRVEAVRTIIRDPSAPIVVVRSINPEQDWIALGNIARFNMRGGPIRVYANPDTQQVTFTLPNQPAQGLAGQVVFDMAVWNEHAATYAWSTVITDLAQVCARATSQFTANQEGVSLLGRVEYLGLVWTPFHGAFLVAHDNHALSVNGPYPAVAPPEPFISPRCEIDSVIATTRIMSPQLGLATVRADQLGAALMKTVTPMVDVALTRPRAAGTVPSPVVLTLARPDQPYEFDRCPQIPTRHSTIASQPGGVYAVTVRTGILARAVKGFGDDIIDIALARSGVRPVLVLMQERTREDGPCLVLYTPTTPVCPSRLNTIR